MLEFANRASANWDRYSGDRVARGDWLRRRVKVDWIDSNIAVGSLLDAEEVVALVRKDVDLIVDARLCFTQLPIQPVVDTVMTSANLLRVLSEQGAKTLIHCVWGVDRTPFLAMVYCAHKNGWSYQRAYEYVKSMHPRTVFHWDWVNLLPLL
jgi:hypothetical protein